jgi:trans-AT polyketide synthase/acyltransferase/oxidoreductase domain-containing protein
MESAQSAFKKILDSSKFNDIKIPIFSNVTARFHTQKDLKKNLLKQITHSVKWTEIVQCLMGLGVEKFEEIGVGNVLTGLINKTKVQADPIIIEKKNEVQEIQNENRSNIQTDDSSINSSQTVDHSFGNNTIIAENLGSAEYKKDYNIKYAYATGAMFRGVSSKELVVKVGKSGLLGFLGTGGLSLKNIEEAILYIQNELSSGDPYGVNLLCNITDPKMEEKTVDLYIKHKIKNIEASAFMQITPALVKYRLNGLTRNSKGDVVANNRIQAKISRPEIAALFLAPAPERIINKLIKENKISSEQVVMSKEIAMADDICVEADSGGHTDMGVAAAIMPAIFKLRDEMTDKFKYKKKIRVGAAGGIGTPQAAAAAFMLGADFIVTGSINQCTVEAGTSDNVKDLLEKINVQDTDYAPAGDMFELGAKVQVLKKGVFFPARANRLYDLYKHYNSIDEIDEKTKKQLQEKYFKRTFEDIYEDTKKYFLERNPLEITKAEKNPKYKMALIFRWYFSYASNLALTGNEKNMVDYQVHCGPALGAFNQWIKGTNFEKWENRHVDVIGEMVMTETANFINAKYKEMISNN